MDLRVQSPRSLGAFVHVIQMFVNRPATQGFHFQVRFRFFTTKLKVFMLFLGIAKPIIKNTYS